MAATSAAPGVPALSADLVNQLIAQHAAQQHAPVPGALSAELVNQLIAQHAAQQNATAVAPAQQTMMVRMQPAQVVNPTLADLIRMANKNHPLVPTSPADRKRATGHELDGFLEPTPHESQRQLLKDEWNDFQEMGAYAFLRQTGLDVYNGLSASHRKCTMCCCGLCVLACFGPCYCCDCCHCCGCCRII
jgi:hypothetical protein